MTTPAPRRACWGLLALAVLSAAPAQALNLCVDEKGNKNYQQSPCPGRRTDASIVPVRTASITEADVIETMRRFDRAWSTRDLDALNRLLAEDMQALNYKRESGQDVRTSHTPSRARFLSRLGKYFNLTSSISLKRSGVRVNVAPDGQSARYESDAQSTVVVTSHTGKSRGTGYVDMRLEIDQLLITKIHSVLLEQDIVTQQAESGL